MNGKYYAVKIQAGQPRIIGKQRHSSSRDEEWRIVNENGRSVAHFVNPEFAANFPLWGFQDLTSSSSRSEVHHETLGLGDVMG